MNTYVEPLSGILVSHRNGQYNRIGDITVLYSLGIMQKIRCTSNGCFDIETLKCPITNYVAGLPKREVMFRFDRENNAIILIVNSVWSGVVTKDGRFYTPIKWNDVDRHFNHMIYI